MFAISETWLRLHLVFNVPGYGMLPDDRLDGYGGAAILVNDVLPFSPLSLPPHGDEINAVGVNIVGINVISVYIPSPDFSCFQYLFTFYLFFILPCNISRRFQLPPLSVGI